MQKSDDDERSGRRIGLAFQVSGYIFLTAVLIYLYTIVGWKYFNGTFLRQLFIIFQTIRIFLLLAVLAPVVLRSQVSQVVPHVEGRGVMVLAVTALLVNLIIAWVIKTWMESCLHWGSLGHFFHVKSCCSNYTCATEDEVFSVGSSSCSSSCTSSCSSSCSSSSVSSPCSSPASSCS